MNQLCSNLSAFHDWKLVEYKTYPFTIFTKDLGSIPTFATSKYCWKCNTCYYYNYYIQNASSPSSLCVYYSNSLTFIQSSQHFYIAIELCELFSTMLVTSFTSATNCAHIYNQDLKNELILPFLPADWQTSLQLDVHDVWSGFFLHALILEHQESGSIFTLPHHAQSQVKCLQTALQARNAKMAGPGQEAWNHTCDCCCHIYQDKSGNHYQIQSTVTVGITIGHPTCSVHDCTIPLSSVRNHFCDEHFVLSKMCCGEV